MSTATVHRRKLATTGAVPSGASAAKPRSRSRRPSIIGGPRSTVPVRSQGAEQPTGAVRAASLHPRPRLEPSGVLRAEGPGPPSHDAGPPRIAPGHLRRRRRLGAASRSASGLLVAPSGPRRRRLPLRHRRCRRGPEHGRGPVGAGHGALPVPERRLLGRRPLRPGHVGFHRGCSRGAGYGLRGRDR